MCRRLLLVCVQWVAGADVVDSDLVIQHHAHTAASSFQLLRRWVSTSERTLDSVLLSAHSVHDHEHSRSCAIWHDIYITGMLPVGRTFALTVRKPLPLRLCFAGTCTHMAWWPERRRGVFCVMPATCVVWRWKSDICWIVIFAFTLRNDLFFVPSVVAASRMAATSIDISRVTCRRWLFRVPRATRSLPAWTCCVSINGHTVMLGLTCALCVVAALNVPVTWVFTVVLTVEYDRTVAESARRRSLRAARWSITCSYTLMNAVTRVLCVLAVSDPLTNCVCTLAYTAESGRTLVTNVHEVLRIDRRWDGTFGCTHVSRRSLRTVLRHCLHL